MSEKYQYLVDTEGLAGEPDESWVDYEQYDGGTPLGLHDTTLFDQNEARDGSLYDEATGLDYDNSGSLGRVALSVMDLYDSFYLDDNGAFHDEFDDDEHEANLDPEALEILELWLRRPSRLVDDFEEYTQEESAA